MIIDLTKKTTHYEVGVISRLNLNWRIIKNALISFNSLNSFPVIFWFGLFFVNVRTREIV